ncbi:hypothetical protein, partial [Enterococcus faecalis]|uniref:hypothetical protein n=1 Tax=Enterococcus faecalis TaxID=1351 RepID=UPI003D6AF759
LFALLMDNDVRELLKEFHPASMRPIEMCLALQIAQRGVIAVDDKFPWAKIVLPRLEDSD